MDIAQRYRGCLLGLAAGDAVGGDIASPQKVQKRRFVREWKAGD